MERRRETSRFAARDRRGKEADIFTDLRDVVPIVEEGTVTHLDRIALLRVAATVCRLRKTAGNVLETELGPEEAESWSEDTITECLDGFVLIADSDSSILYVSESVQLYLGLTQTDLTGRTLRDFLHPSDYDEFIKVSGELYKPKDDNEEDSVGIEIVLRMKTVISPRGRCLNLKSALFKPVAFYVNSKKSVGGHVLLMQGTTIIAGQGSINANASALTKYTDTPTGAFMTRHTCDMRISFVSDRFNYILRSELKSLMGTSYYELVHPLDIVIVSKSMKELFQKGHIRTPFYRLVAANNTLAWVQTEATTISHTTKGTKGQYVMCIHYVLGIQGADESLVVCTSSMPAGVQVDIKKEIDDTRDYIGRQPEIVECVDFTPLIGEEAFEVENLRPLIEPIKTTSDMGTRKSSYDDVLQWLFRDQPSSPPPTRYRSAERLSNSSRRQQEQPQTTSTRPRFQLNSTCNDPTLASTQFMDSASRATRSPISHASTSSSRHSPFGRRAQSSGCGERTSSQATNYSPLAEGLSQCGINSPPSVESGKVQYRDAGSMVGIVDSTDSARCFSTVQTSDTIDVPSSGLATSIGQTTDVFPTLSFTNSNIAANETQLNLEPIICDDLQWEEPDLSGLAPFVDTCDMMQIADSLPPELQGLYDLPDYTPAVPSVPAARPVKLEKSRGSPPAKRMMAPSMDYLYRNPPYESYNQQQQQQSQQQEELYWPVNNNQQESETDQYQQFRMLS